HGARVAIGAATGQAENAGLEQVPAYQLDMTDEQSIAAFFDRCESELGGLDALIMMAAPVQPKAALDTSAERYREVLEQELYGPVLCIKEAATRMKSRGRGRIISFAS